MSDWLIIVVVALPLIALWALAIVEVVRRRDLGGGRTAAWVGALALAPLVALVVYIVLRPPRPVESSRTDADTTTAERIVVLAERRQRGELSDAEYRDEVRRIRADRQRPADAA